MTWTRLMVTRRKDVDDKINSMEDKTMSKCIICKKEMIEKGNNPAPIKKMDEGLCCNSCNILLVLPARIKEVRNEING